MSAQAAEKRPLGALGRMGVVAAMHVAVVLVLANSFGLIPKFKGPERMEAVRIDESPPVDPTPSEIPYVPADPQIYLPMPDVPLAEPDDTGTITATQLPPDEIPIGAGRVVPEPIPVSSARVDPRHPLTQPRYPPEMTRAGTEGAVEVEIYVQPDGRVGEARIAKSSGFDSFDRSTLLEARGWTLVPATRGTEKIAQWYRLRVVFKLKNQ
jgi:periplasmic protein TonB